MPAYWCANFIHSGQNAQQTLIEVLCTYMVQQELQTGVHRKKVGEVNKKTQSKIP